MYVGNTLSHNLDPVYILSYNFGAVYCNRIKLFLWFGDVMFYENIMANTKFQRILVRITQTTAGDARLQNSNTYNMYHRTLHGSTKGITSAIFVL